jgi:hypothetical protein
MQITEFVATWREATVTERAGAQSHFHDLCAVLGEKTPVQADPKGVWYAFERAVTKADGKPGFADVWRRGHFAWEYKKKRRDLKAAYAQLNEYRDALENPPLLVVCDTQVFEVHTSFTGLPKQVYRFDLDDLLANVPTPACPRPPLEVLRALFEAPYSLMPQQSPDAVTQGAAAQFGTLARSLQARGHEPQKIARFLIRLLFCLFAEDIGLLEAGLFTRTLESYADNPEEFGVSLSALFRAMQGGGPFGPVRIPKFNGGLFTDDAVLPLERGDLAVLRTVAALDWRRIEPSIFGTLFERGLDPAKRSQLGAHYTSREDIELIVEPVVMQPLRRRWEAVKDEAAPLLAAVGAAKAEMVPGLYPREAARVRAKIDAAVERATEHFRAFGRELASVRILDPACGSGNFLYVALRQLLDLEREVVTHAARLGLPAFAGSVGPEQMRGIELNEYAHELAPVTIWIGYIQWLHENRAGRFEEPILRRMDMIEHRDALLTEREGVFVEAEWPEADFIVGNPPFLGGSKLRRELGDEYAERLWKVYEGRVPGGADLVCYWFEKTRALIEAGRSKRAGLLSTNGIRYGQNRTVLDSIKRSGDLFLAWSDRPWVLDGAAVRVSIVAFDDGTEKTRSLDGQEVVSISPDLSGRTVDITAALVLDEKAMVLTA